MTDWGVPPGSPVLGRGEVHLWKAVVSEWARRENDLLAVLDAVEASRAARFHFAEHRTQYVVAHGVVRQVLGRYLGEAPHALEFGAGPVGKPYLRRSDGARSLQFNLSHSDDIVLIAVAAAAVGVDIEHWSTGFDPVELADHFFSAPERTELRAIDGDGRTAGFFACWARKEAYIKATGVGVSDGLDHFDVTVAADRPGQLIADRRAPAAAQQWEMIDIDAGPRCAAAVVTSRPAGVLRFFAFPPD